MANLSRSPSPSKLYFVFFLETDREHNRRYPGDFSQERPGVSISLPAIIVAAGREF